MSHQRGTWTPGEGPEGWSPLGAKAEAAGRAADILKNVEGFPHIVVHVGTRSLREADGLRLLGGQNPWEGALPGPGRGSSEHMEAPGSEIQRTRVSESQGGWGPGPPPDSLQPLTLWAQGLSQDGDSPLEPYWYRWLGLDTGGMPVGHMGSTPPVSTLWTGDAGRSHGPTFP